MPSIVQAARNEIGTPFRWQGRESGTGLDCSGLVSSSFRNAGSPLADKVDYAPFSDYSDMMGEYLRKSFSVALGPSPGAVVAFWLRRPGKIRHLGIITEQINGVWHFVHTYEMLKAAIEEPLEHGWLKRVESFWRLK